MTRILSLLILTLFCMAPSIALAVSIEAVGRSIVVDGDLDSARARAVERAKEQASLYSMAQIATTQSIRDGILEIDNLRVNTLSKLENLEILSERIDGNQLSVHIRVDLEPQQGCGDRSAPTAYRKPIALLQWTIDTPREANRGGLNQLGQLLPALMAQRLDEELHLQAIDASHRGLTASSQEAALNPQYQAQLRAATSSLNSQYLVAGRIKSLAMESERTDTEHVLLDNPVTRLGQDLGNRAGLLGVRDLRFFAAEVELMDAATGALLQRYQLMTQGAWRLGYHSRITSLTGFANEPYGRAVLDEIERLIDGIADSLECEPLEAKIVRAQGSEIWIDKGSLSGINQGDRLSVVRRVQTFDAGMQPIVERESTDLQLRIDRVELNRAQGTLSELSEVANIQSDDLAVGY